MQFEPQRAYPYPVLRPGVDDYVDGDIQLTADIQTSPDQAVVKGQIEFVLSVPDIVTLVKEGKAQYVAVFSCRDTYLRRSFKSQAPSFSVEFQNSVLRGEVTIHGYVIASQRIKNFTSSLLNPEFGNGPMGFPRGAILAMDEPQAVYIDRELLRPITSIFSITKKEGLSLDEALEAFLFKTDVRANLIERPTSSQTASVFSAVINQLHKSYGADRELFERNRFRGLMRGINAVGGYRLLEFLETQEVEALVVELTSQ